MNNKIFILVTDDDIDHMLYSETRDEIKRCNAEILRLRKLLAAEQKRVPDSLKAVVSRLPKSPKTGKPLLVKGG